MSAARLRSTSFAGGARSSAGAGFAGPARAFEDGFVAASSTGNRAAFSVVAIVSSPPPGPADACSASPSTFDGCSVPRSKVPIGSMTVSARKKVCLGRHSFAGAHVSGRFAAQQLIEIGQRSHQPCVSTRKTRATEKSVRIIDSGATKRVLTNGDFGHELAISRRLCAGNPSRSLATTQDCWPKGARKRPKAPESADSGLNRNLSTPSERVLTNYCC